MIMLSLGIVLTDPDHFPEPEKFKPERFLEKSPGSGKMVYKPNPALITFGVGKRKCLGESLARIELFLFLTTLLHQFSFEKSPDHDLPDVNDCSISISRVPKPFHAKITVR